MSQFHSQIDESVRELAQVGQLARQADLRLSFHPAQHVLLNSPNPELVARSRADLTNMARLLDLMNLNGEAVVVTHTGGVYGDRAAARWRFVREFWALPEPTRRRLVLENDDTRFAVSDTVWIHQQTGVRLVFDNLHHRLNNPTGWPAREALAACLATWPAGERPKIHFSTPRTDWLVIQKPEAEQPEVRKARWSYHSDYVNPFEFIDFICCAEGLPEFDIMLEVRAKDLALLQLRDDLNRYAPEIARRLPAQSLPLDLSPMAIDAKPTPNESQAEQ
jgi:UV DNA damage endonuclease